MLIPTGERPFIIPCPVREPHNCFALFYFVINACISHVVITLIRYFLIQKSRDLVSHNPGISRLINGPGSRYPGIRDPGIAIPRCQQTSLHSTLTVRLHRLAPLEPICQFPVHHCPVRLCPVLQIQLSHSADQWSVTTLFCALRIYTERTRNRSAICSSWQNVRGQLIGSRQRVELTHYLLLTAQRPIKTTSRVAAPFYTQTRAVSTRVKSRYDVGDSFRSCN